ncbi:MAG: outer membrane protein assembly factor BamA [Deltaproteobacteria bacterium]|nr:MAG: outer membrane protein assembly factor BamA [Deltaproteobacteria bacterium]
MNKYLILLVCLIILPGGVAARSLTPEKVGVLPFSIHAGEEMAYLEDDIRKVIEKRLSADGAEIVTLKPLPGEAKISSDIDPEKIRQIGIEAGADFVVWGSMTWIDGQYSIDAKVMSPFSTDPVLDPIRTYFISGHGIENIPNTITGLSRQLAFHIFKREKIARVLIMGNQRIEADVIRKNIHTGPGDVFLTKSLSDDLRRIYGMGYFDDVRIESEEGPDGKTIIITVKEKPTIRKIKFKGNRVFEDKELLDILDLKTGAILNNLTIQENIDRLESRYKEKNYQNIQIKPQVESVANNQGDLTFLITEGGKVRIKKIEFMGNSVYSDDDLRDEMKTSEKGIFSWLTSSGDLKREDLDQDISRLTAFYQNNGFIDARVGEPDVTTKDNWIYIKIKIYEGARYKVGKIALTGDLIRPTEALMKKIKISKEPYFNRKVLRNDIVYLSDLYADRGYAYPNIIPKIDKDKKNRVVNIDINVQKGPQVYFEKIIIGGNTRTRDKVIRRMLKVNEGGLFSGEKLRRSVRNLQRLGYFEDVQVNTRKGSADDQMILDIQVKEKSTGNFSLGGGYSSVEKVFATGSITERNLLGYGVNLQMKANLSSKTTRYSLSLTEPWLFDIPLSAGIELYNWEYDYDTYDKKSTGGSLKAGYPIFRDTRLYLKYYYDIADVDNIDEDAAQSIKDLEGKNVTSAVTAALHYDSRNRFFYTTRGQDHRISIEYAGIGGDVKFTKYTGELGIYFPILYGLVGFLHTEGGYVEQNGNGLLPDYERFYLGGIHSIRGFKWRDISARDEDGAEIGGEKYVQFNAEIHIPLLREAGLLGVLFYDTGNVFGTGDKIDLGQLRQGAGFGIRWNSPVGPIRLERGYILDPEEGEDRDGRWEFTMEAAF